MRNISELPTVIRFFSILLGVSGENSSKSSGQKCSIESGPRFLSCSRVPPFWQLETELCRLYQSLGSHRAALDIALRLRQWEVVIECYHLLQVCQGNIEISELFNLSTG